MKLGTYYLFLKTYLWVYMHVLVGLIIPQNFFELKVNKD